MEEKQKLKDDVPPSYSALPPKEGYSPVIVVDKPPDYLWLSVFTIACCFWPVSILAILKSIEVRSHIVAGRVEEAKRASRQAKRYNLLSICLNLSMIFMIYAVTILALTPVWILIARGNQTDSNNNDTNYI
ncbi:PREDICTED: proline-rich transmembrane protein 1-like [Amphimedon queenslandica]|uniref:Uncharacterized protein n=1 Tax=Amphimedon queenslandica TaxID=400682 RepID=A0A1X7VD53_AMPQE|nr:PREDICTED: proline-rich transmembrane protein 1-like [Amphimedon queenslandica]|eukprot:XP_003384749.1 PREDICTED: proline-rich transmembrane protein 1-like [Amphimedon queenslandica]